MTSLNNTSQLGIGIIGCGKISQAYFDGAKIFSVLRLVACADLHRPAAVLQAEKNGCLALSVDELLAHPEIDLIINLTIPAAHAEVSLRAVGHRKHVYSEKPITVHLADAEEILRAAEEAGVRVGNAPDTFLGGGIQTCRRLIDEGAIGRVIAGTAFMLSSGPESWHPNPGFYYLEGGGPVLDMAPYYLTALVNLIGPVRRVCGIVGKAHQERVATCAERNGEILPVEVATHASATLEFVSGAIITAVFSFDVQAHAHHNIELYGTEGSLKVPDPNTFSGPVSIYRNAPGENQWAEVQLTHPYTANHRSIGAADMASAILNDRLHRANGHLATHVLEVMHAIEKSSLENRYVEIERQVERPHALPSDLELGQIDP